MLKIGREEPVASMDSSGKIIWARHNEVRCVFLCVRVCVCVCGGAFAGLCVLRRRPPLSSNPLGKHGTTGLFGLSGLGALPSWSLPRLVCASGNPIFDPRPAPSPQNPFQKPKQVQTVNVKSLGADCEVVDGERLPLAVKDLGACDVYPQSLRHNPNGRFVTVCGDGE